MSGGVEVFVEFWKEWGIQALLLLSFSLQVILVISAEIRQRQDSGMLRGIIWTVYLLADSTAIYALGHMSVATTISRSCSSLPEHQLVAFWAPFLLLHLGGQDNITAYSIEDNRLWLRHLQTFVVQVVAAAYVLYESPVVGRQLATILMFVVGALKYGERVWALKCASSGNLSGKNYQSFGRVHIEYPNSRMILPIPDTGRAHQLLNFPRHLLQGPLPLVELQASMKIRDWREMYQVAEVQLSLMYEVFYSKAPVIHTWYGVCIRAISPMATVSAFLLFRGLELDDHVQKDGYYTRVDIFVTYILLVGAVVLEITSLLRSMFSSWAQAGLITTSFSPSCHRNEILVRILCTTLLIMSVFPGFLIKFAMRKAGIPVKYWSGSMGQHNFIQLCTKSKHSRSSKIARWMGREDWWNTLVYTSSIPVPADFSQLLEKQLLRSVGVSKESSDHINNSRGRAALKGMGILQEELASWSVDIQLDESILVWHIATHVYLCWWDKRHSRRPALAKAIKVLSNYMMFLLAARPYMLPDNASRQSYIELCNKVINHLDYRSEEDLIRSMQEHGVALNTTSAPPAAAAETETERLNRNFTFDRASHLAAMLIGRSPAAGADIMDLVAQVWVEMLCYVSYRCRSDSHARQLSNGGEITTVVAILMQYMNSDFFGRIGLEKFQQP